MIFSIDEFSVAIYCNSLENGYAVIYKLFKHQVIVVWHEDKTYDFNEFR